MKRSVLIITLSIIAVFISLTFSHAEPYIIAKLTDNDSADNVPQINDNGDMVWIGKDITGYVRMLFFYDNSSGTATAIDSDPWLFNARLNARGDVTWRGGAHHVMRFYNRSTGSAGGPPGWLTQYQNSIPQLNDSGKLVFEGSFNLREPEIYLYDGDTGTNINLSNSDNIEHDPVINSKGDVVWVGCETTIDEYGDYHCSSDDDTFPHTPFVVLYDSSTGTATELILTPGGSSDPQISDNGDVVWAGGTHHGQDIVLHDRSAGTTRVISLHPNAYIIDSSPRINADGDVVWYAPEAINLFQFKDLEIFFYDSSTEVITQLTHNNIDDRDPQINKDSYVVWEGQDSTDGEIYLAVPSVTTKILSDNTWRSYNSYQPGWEMPGFDDSGWRNAHAPYPHPLIDPPGVWIIPWKPGHGRNAYLRRCPCSRSALS